MTEATMMVHEEITELRAFTGFNYMASGSLVYKKKIEFFNLIPKSFYQVSSFFSFSINAWENTIKMGVSQFSEALTVPVNQVLDKQGIFRASELWTLIDIPFNQIGSDAFRLKIIMNQ